MTDINSYDFNIEDGHVKNVVHYKNIISPFCKEENIRTIKSVNKTVIDRNYGLVYDEEFVKEKIAVYGVANKLPMYSGDQLSNYGFLRVPFRKIPRVMMNDRQDLDNFLISIDSRDPNLKLQFRGQNSEYFIDRSSEEKLALYGDESILEPSLIPSAVRRSISMDDIMPLWNNMLQQYLDSLIVKVPINLQSSYVRDMINFKTSPNFALFSLAIAQHYGLPSIGLDSTINIETALFFATHKFINDNGKCFYKQNLNELKSPPVIYILAPPERFQINYNQFKPPYSEFLRPDQQMAHFLQTGWGFNKNKNARQIWMALYLNPKGDFGNISKANDLFPANDEFAKFIKPIIDKINNEKLSPFFKDFYTLTY